MTREEFQEVTTSILADASDTGRLSEHLDSLRNAFNDEVTRAETAETSVSELTTRNENLQRANMQLFLKTGEAEKAEPETEENAEATSFEDLFDENGELK